MKLLFSIAFFALTTFLNAQPNVNWLKDHLASINSISVEKFTGEINFHLIEVAATSIENENYGLIKFTVPQNFKGSLSFLFTARYTVQWGLNSSNGEIPDGDKMYFPCYGYFRGLNNSTIHRIDGQAISIPELNNVNLIWHTLQCFNENLLIPGNSYVFWFKTSSFMEDYWPHNIYYSLIWYENENDEIEFFTKLTKEKVIENMNHEK